MVMSQERLPAFVQVQVCAGVGVCVYNYLVKIAFGISQKGDAVSLPDADCHGGETGRWSLPHGFSFQRHFARHGAGGVVRTARVRFQSVLQCVGG